MCRMISFFHNPNTGDIKVWDLTGHSETQEHLCLDDKYWREGHYLKDGTVECRVLDTDRYTQKECNDRLIKRYPTFKKFLKWCLGQKIYGNIDLSNCDVKNLIFPKKIGGYLDLSYCDVKCLIFPEEIGSNLYLFGCDVRGLKLPKKIVGDIYLNGYEKGYDELM